MTFREAYETFCTYRNGYLPDYFDEAVRTYMYKVDDLIAENTALSVDLKRALKNLRRMRLLKEKYYKQLKEVTKL